jgi:hypothetical protein
MRPALATSFSETAADDLPQPQTQQRGCDCNRKQEQFEGVGVLVSGHSVSLTYAKTTTHLGLCSRLLPRFCEGGGDFRPPLHTSRLATISAIIRIVNALGAVEAQSIGDGVGEVGRIGEACRGNARTIGQVCARRGSLRPDEPRDHCD